MPTRKALKTTDAKLKLVEEKLGIGTWTWDLDTAEVVWSPGLCHILGFDAHDVVPSIDLYQQLVHPDDQIDFDDATGIVSSKRLESRRFRIIRPDGVLRHLFSQARPHFDRNGRTIFLMGVICDVTDDETARFDHMLQKETSRVLTKHLEGDVWRAHPDGKLIETAHWTKLTGQTPQQAHDWGTLAAIHPEDRSLFRDAWSKATAKGDLFQATIRVRLTDGTYQLRRSKAYPIKDASGSIQQWLGHTISVKPEVIAPASSARLNSPLIRASRALLDWTAPELAERSGISFSTIRRMEQDAASVRDESLVRVRETFEAAGIRYATAEGGGIALSFMDDR